MTMREDMTVAVQVFAYSEPDLTYTLDALADQYEPPWLDTRLEAWVTPDGPPEDDQTWRQAEAHEEFRARLAPAGKLSARNAAHDAAGDAGVDAIAAWDADAPPLTSSTLELLTAPLHDERAVATNSRPHAPWTPLGAVTNAVGWAQDALQPHMNGQAHAFDAVAWDVAGPFIDGSVDQTSSSRHVRREEEFAFRRRLEKIGHVEDVREATVYNDTRRTGCRVTEPFAALGLDVDPYCRRRSGTVTFTPDEAITESYNERNRR